MKKRRFIFWMILVILLLFAGGGVIHAYHQLQTRLLEYMGSDESETDLDWKRLRFFNEDGHRGLSVSEVISMDKVSGDSLFYADQIVLYSKSDLSEIKSAESMGLYIENPVIFVKNKTSGSDTLSGAENLKFSDLPSFYMRNLCIVNESKAGQIQRIDGIDFKAENLGNAYDVNIRYADSATNDTYLIAALLSGSFQNLRVDSAFVEYKDYRLFNFSLALNSHKRVTADYEFRIYNEQYGSSAFPIDSLSDNSYLLFDFFVRHWEGDYESQSKADVLLENSDGLIIELQHEALANAQIDDANTLLDVESADGDLHYAFEKSLDADKLIWNQSFKSDLKLHAELLDSILLTMDIDADFSQFGNGKQCYSQGYISDFSTLLLGNKQYEMQHVISGRDNFVRINENPGDFEGKFEFRQLVSEILNGEGVFIHTDLYASSLILPADQQSSNRSLANQEIDSPKSPEWLKSSDIALNVQLDSLISVESLIAQNLHFNLLYKDETLDVNSGLALVGESQGEIHAVFSSFEGNYHGALESDGLLIANQKHLPLLSGSLDLLSDTAMVQAFRIPFSYQDESLQIEPSIVRTDEFLMMISGDITPEMQKVKFGITAPAKKFKGAAAIVLSRKSNDMNGLKTVLLDVTHQDGKTNINTEVIEKEL